MSEHDKNAALRALSDVTEALTRRPWGETSLGELERAGRVLRKVAGLLALEEERRRTSGFAANRGAGPRRATSESKPRSTSNAGKDDADLTRAARELDDARRALLEAHAIPESRARREAVLAAASRLTLANRMIAEVAERRGG